MTALMNATATMVALAAAVCGVSLAASSWLVGLALVPHPNPYVGFEASLASLTVVVVAEGSGKASAFLASGFAGAASRVAPAFRRLLAVIPYLSPAVLCAVAWGARVDLWSRDGKDFQYSVFLLTATVLSSVQVARMARRRTEGVAAVRGPNHSHG